MSQQPLSWWINRQRQQQKFVQIPEELTDALQALAAHMEEVERELDFGLAKIMVQFKALEALGQQLEALIKAIPSTPPPAAKATKLVVSIQGGHSTMPVSISVDATGAHADYAWTDDKDNATTAPVDAAGQPFKVTLASDNPAVATLAQDPNTPTRFDITEIATGDFNVTTSVVDSTGAAGVWPAGSPGTLAGTPITDAPVACVVVAGAAGALTTTVAAA